jgi:ATPase subunit of ABC transporter with duplicated ATPase domains
MTGAGLTKSYGSKTLFRDLSVPVRRGDRLAIVGPNGLGKTTLLNVIQGAMLPDSGSVRFGANAQLASVSQNPDELELSSISAAPSATP